MKRKHITIAILMLCAALFVLFMVVSMPETHDCSGEECPVCLFRAVIRGLAALSDMLRCAYRAVILLNTRVRAGGREVCAPMCVSLFDRRTLLLD